MTTDMPASGDWEAAFLGREEELAWLVEAWHSLKAGGGPLLRVLKAEPGYGKTRLALRFYETLARDHDPHNFWPAVKPTARRDSTIMPEVSDFSTDQEPVPAWFWLGLNWPRPNNEREMEQSESPFKGLLDKDAVSLFTGACLRRFNDMERRKEAAGRLGWSLVRLGFKGALNMTTFGIGSEIFDSISSYASAAMDGRDSTNEIGGAIRDLTGQTKEAGKLTGKEKEEEVITNYLNMCASLIDQGGRTDAAQRVEPLPMILFLDDTQWLDRFSLKLVSRLWRQATEQGWPLLLVATHWEKEWNEKTQDAFAQEDEPPSFAAFCGALERGAEPGRVAVWRLGKLEPCGELLRMALPGLSAENHAALVERVSGNPRHLTELIRLLLDTDGYLSTDGDLDESERENLLVEAIDFEKLEQKRYRAASQQMRQMLGVASLQGLRYLPGFALEVASRVDGLVENQKGMELLEAAIDPYAFSELVDRSAHGFRSSNLHTIAYRYLQNRGAYFAEAREAFLAVGRQTVKAWGEVPQEERELLLNALYRQAQEADDETLCLQCTVRALAAIHHGGSWGAFGLWQARWEELADERQRFVKEAIAEDDESHWVLFYMGTIYKAQRVFDAAVEAYSLYSDFAEKAGQWHKLGGTYHNIGMVYEEQRRWAQALEKYQKAIEWYEKTEQWHELGGTYHQIGRVYEEQRQWEEALEKYQKAIKWMTKTEQWHKLGSTYHNIGIVYQEQRRWEEALEAYQKAIEWNEKTEQWHKLGTTYHQIGMVYEEQRRWAQALEEYQNAIEWYEKTEQWHELGSSYHHIGMVYQEQRQWEEALEKYQKAIIWMTKTEQWHELGSTYHQIGRVYEEQRRWEQALEEYQKAIEWHEKTEQWHKLGGTYHQIGMVYQKQRRWEEALETYHKAIEWYEKTEQWHTLGSTYHQIGMVYQQQGRWEQALEEYQKAIEWMTKTEQWHTLGNTYACRMLTYAAMASAAQGEAATALYEEAARDALKAIDACVAHNAHLLPAVVSLAQDVCQALPDGMAAKSDLKERLAELA